MKIRNYSPKFCVCQLETYTIMNTIMNTVDMKMQSCRRFEKKCFSKVLAAVHQLISSEFQFIVCEGQRLDSTWRCLFLKTVDIFINNSTGEAPGAGELFWNETNFLSSSPVPSGLSHKLNISVLGPLSEWLSPPKTMEHSISQVCYTILPPFW